MKIKYGVLLLVIALLTIILVVQSKLNDTQKFIKVTSIKPFEPNIGYVSVNYYDENGRQHKLHVQLEFSPNNPVLFYEDYKLTVKAGYYNVKLTNNSSINSETEYIDSLYIPNDTLTELYIKVQPSGSFLIDGKLSYRIDYNESPKRIIRGRVFDRNTNDGIQNAIIISPKYNIEMATDQNGEFSFKTLIFDIEYDLIVKHNNYESYYFKRVMSIKNIENVKIPLNKKINREDTDTNIIKLELSVSDGGLNYGKEIKTHIGVSDRNIIDSTVIYNFGNMSFRVVDKICNDSISIDFNDKELCLRGEDWRSRNTFSPLIITTDEKCLTTMTDCAGTIFCFRIIKD